MTFLVAGHETTNVTVNWALYLLAQHSHEQDLLREELVKAFPDKSKFNPTFDEINSLEYLNCVVKESLRLHPPGIILIGINVLISQVFNKLKIYKVIILTCNFFTLVPILKRTNIKDKVLGEYLIPK